MYSLYFDYLYLKLFPFFEGVIWVLIAPVPEQCILFYFYRRSATFHLLPQFMPAVITVRVEITRAFSESGKGKSISFVTQRLIRFKKTSFLLYIFHSEA